MSVKDRMRKTPYSGVTLTWIIVGSVMLIYSHWCSRFIYWEKIVLAVSPATIFIIILYVRKKKPFNIKYLKMLNYFVTTIFITLFLINSFNIMINECTKGITDISYYNRILRIYGCNSKELKHFPKKIPKGVSNIEFYEIPQFLQGGAEIRLAYITNEEEIKTIVDKYKDVAYKVIEDYMGEHSEHDEVWIPHFIPKDKDKGQLKIFILDSKPGKSNGWNHGYSYGVAIEMDNKKVIYWYQIW